MQYTKEVPTVVNPEILKPHFKDKFVSIDEMCKGWGVYVTRVLQRCKRLREEHRFAWKGFSRKKDRYYVAEIPAEIAINPLSPFRKYFDHSITDPKERRKLREEFLKKYPEFRVTDKGRQ